MRLFGLVFLLTVFLALGCQSEQRLRNGASIQANITRIDACIIELAYQIKTTNRSIKRLEAALRRTK